MKYLIELVADTKGLEPAIDGIQELNQKERELKKTTTEVSAEQKKLMDNYATQAKIGKENLDKLTQGYKEVSKAATGAFGGTAIKETTKQAESFRTQLRNSREEIIKLFQSGKVTTSQIYEMARGAGDLKDSMGDAQQAINVLSSDTFKLDVALQGLQVGAAGFQVMTGAAALFGAESEELQKVLVRLNAVMAITNGLKQIQDGLQKQTALSLGLNIAAQKAYNFVVGTSTGTLKAFRIALAATGIGLAVIAIAALVANWDKLSEAIVGATQSSEDFIKAKEKSIELSDKELDRLDTELKYRVVIGKLTEKQAQEKRLIEISKQSLQLTKELNVETEKLNKMLDIRKSKETILGVRRSTSITQNEVDEQRKKVEALIELQQKRIILIDEEKKKLQDLNKEDDKTDKQKIESKKINTAELDRLNREMYESELAKIKKNRESFEEAEKAKQLASAETNRYLQMLYEDQQEANKANLAAFRADQEAAAKEDREIKRQNYLNEIKLSEEKDLAIKDASIQIAQITADAIFQITNANRNASFNADIQKLEAQKARELKNKELTDAQKERIEARYQRQIAAIKTKQAQADKAAAISQAIINGALAITKLWVNPGFPAAIPMVAVVAATTAAQIAVISAQKIPKFAKGTEYVKGGGTETSDSVPAMLSKGERVIDAKTNKLLKGIPNKMIPELLMPSSTVIKDGMDYDRLAKSFSKELANNPQLLVNFDRKGFETFIKSGNTTTQIKNNRNAV